jgi:hypothetical protein
MAKSTYAFGLESPVRFEISDRLAEDFNEAARRFYKAQQQLNQKWGKKWNPTEKPIAIKWSRGQQKAWNTLATLFTKVYLEADKQGCTIHANDFMDDYLVKDVALQSAVKLIGNKSRIVTLAVMAGALYGYLRGL